MHHRRSHRNVRPSSPRTAGNCLQFEPLEPRHVLSGVAELLLDVNATTLGRQTSSSPQQYFVSGDHAFFIARSSGVAGLWGTDGTEAGTTRIRTFQSIIQQFTNVNGVFYFSASEVNDSELWRTDGTSAGTWRVKDIHPMGSSSPTSLVNVDGTLYFSAIGDSRGMEIWKSDGTAAGTEFAYDVIPGPSGSQATPQFSLNGDLIFTSRNSEGVYSIFSADGSSPSPLALRTFSSNSFFANFTQVGSTLYFTVNQGSDGIELWRTDGTADGTMRVADVNPDGLDTLGSLTNVGGTLFFVADRATLDGSELWKTDGTAVGTVLVKDIRNGVASSTPQNLFNFSGLLYFAANDGVNGNELWRSDGTADGTTLVEDVNVGPASSNPTHFANINDALYFSAATAGEGAEVRKLNGAAVELVHDVFPGADGSNASRFANFNGQILFNAANSADVGVEPWISDGAAGARLLKNIHISTASSNPSKLVELNGVYFFVAYDGVHGYELWRTDGTTAGTLLFKDVNPGISRGISNLNSPVRVNDKLYFAASNGPSGSELWSTDGTAEGTTLVKDVRPGISASYPRQLTNVDGVLYYVANDSHGAELWRSDGTEAGTVLVADLRPGADSSNPYNLAVADGTLYFTAETPETGREVWKLAPGESVPTQVTNFADASILSSTARLTAVNDRVFFTRRDSVTGDELWVVDYAGTRRVVAFSPLATPSAPTIMVNVNGVLYFNAIAAGHGRELWRSDGTPEGTFEILDLQPGSAGSSPHTFVNLNGTLFFSATTSTTGTELWKSDGTAAGTVLAADVIPGPTGSEPFTRSASPLYAVIGDRLYFSARPTSPSIYWISETSSGAIPVTDAYTLEYGRGGNGAFANLNGDLAFINHDNDGVGAEMFVLRQSAIEQSGDYTGDGVVDGSDFLAWQRSYNTRVEPFGSGADGSGNGVVNGFDLDVWKGNFGKQLAPAEVAATALAAASTPPADAPLAALDAAFAGDADTESESRSVGVPATDERPAAPLRVGAAAIALRDATAVASHGRQAPAASRRRDDFIPMERSSETSAYRPVDRIAVGPRANATTRPSSSNVQARTAAFDDLASNRLALSLAGTAQ